MSKRSLRNAQPRRCPASSAGTTCAPSWRSRATAVCRARRVRSPCGTRPCTGVSRRSSGSSASSCSSASAAATCSTLTARPSARRRAPWKPRRSAPSGACSARTHGRAARSASPRANCSRPTCCRTCCRGSWRSIPEIEIEVDVSNANVDLTRRDADVALRATLQPPDELVGRKLATLHYALYASPRLLKTRRSPPLLARLPWVGFDDRCGRFSIARWLREAMPRVRPQLRVESMGAMLRMAAEGLGAVAFRRSRPRRSIASCASARRWTSR